MAGESVQTTALRLALRLHWQHTLAAWRQRQFDSGYRLFDNDAELEEQAAQDWCAWVADVAEDETEREEP